MQNLLSANEVELFNSSMCNIDNTDDHEIKKPKIIFDYPESFSYHETPVSLELPGIGCDYQQPNFFDDDGPEFGNYHYNDSENLSQCRVSFSSDILDKGLNAIAVNKSFELQIGQKACDETPILVLQESKIDTNKCKNVLKELCENFDVDTIVAETNMVSLTGDTQNESLWMNLLD